MNSAQTRLAIADLTATLATDFDIPTVLHAIAEHAQQCFDAASAAVILFDSRRTDGTGIQIVAEAMREDTIADPYLHISGPGLTSARDGAVAMIADLDDTADSARWPDYRRRARAAGLRSVRAFPIKTMTLSVGSLVVHAEQPWGNERPNDFGQILADLTAIALSMGTVDGRASTTADTVATVLDGTMVIATAVGILAEYFDLDVDDARIRLRRLARAHQVTPTAQATAVVSAQNRNPRDPGTDPALHFPADLTPPRHIDR
ncbi:GAF domain-containing protein [Nocardia fluminea]|uniref:GAF domain-containing protein n=1 Tax=Nocardia fluminea TaxID=134984 RepID=UPI0033D0ECFF